MSLYSEAFKLMSGLRRRRLNYVTVRTSLFGRNIILCYFVKSVLSQRTEEVNKTPDNTTQTNIVSRKNYASLYMVSYTGRIRLFLPPMDFLPLLAVSPTSLYFRRFEPEHQQFPNFCASKTVKRGVFVKS
jgi:hypothetical protein